MNKKEREEYNMVAANEARGCEMDKLTLKVQSSDCNASVADVTITSSADLTIAENEPGIYVGKVCGMPTTLSLQKNGFEPLTTTVTGAAETVNVTLTCSEPLCTVHTANITVMSACTSSPVEGIAITGQNVVDVTTSNPGFYQIAVCSQPTLVNLERNWYASQQVTISDGLTISILCENCTDGWHKHEKSCYFFSQHQVSWSDAMTYCEGFHGYLAEIDDYSENAFLWREVNSLNDYFWVGGTDSTKDNHWVWAHSQTPLNTSGFQDWGSVGNQPDNSGGNEHCMDLRPHIGGWNDYQCQKPQFFICEKDLN